MLTNPVDIVQHVIVTAPPSADDRSRPMPVIITDATSLSRHDRIADEWLLGRDVINPMRFVRLRMEPIVGAVSSEVMAAEHGSYVWTTTETSPIT